jgi:hypothetical protein
MQHKRVWGGRNRRKKEQDIPALEIHS